MLEAVDEAVTQHLAGWAPETAVDMINMFEKEMPGMLENLGAAFATLGDRTSSDMPLDPIVGEHMGELASAAHSMADVARELASSFRQKHEVEINRIENPRAAENVWDRTD